MRSDDSAGSPWSPFRHGTFTVLWTATVVSNIGTWMYNAASGWLMTSLNPDPVTVSMVQAATTLPVFLFALPAGALADIVDKRRLLLFAEAGVTVVAAIFAAFVWLSLVTPVNLLLFVFLIGAGSALMAPAWQSIVPQLVPKQDLTPAVAANSVGFNLSRAVGPALGGIIAAGLGIAAPFWLNAASYLGIIGALLWWRPPQTRSRRLPAEHFTGAIRAGFRYVRYNRPFRAALMRAVGFFLFSSAYWALLPLVARTRISGGPEIYGILLGAIGGGAVGAALCLPWLKAHLGPDRLVAAGTLSTVAALILFGLARDVMMALVASAIAGVSWITVLASLNVSAQFALPDWVRGRGLAMFVTVVFGAMTCGSAIWGKVAGITDLPVAHFIAAAGALLTVALTGRWKLQTGVGIDLTPSVHWPVPLITRGIEHDQGPVLVMVEYRIDPRSREEFLAALYEFAHERRRDGAYEWGVFEDSSEEGRFLETFLVESWLEHLRQHERVTQFDKALQDKAQRFHLQGTPKVTHFVSASSKGKPD
jgi:predicted MFS family arabinose efflux permease